MRPRSPGLLLLLLWGLQAESQEEVRAMVGSDVRLRCIYPEENSFDLNDLYVYWQISMAGKGNTDSVVTYHLSGNRSADLSDDHYKDRAQLSLDSMKRGDFSLHLRNITPQDEQKFICLVFQISLQLKKILEVTVTLHVAANYSMPVVSGPSQDEELTFTCTSTNGYPRPNVYWINKTDNSVLDDALHNSTVSLNARGLYDVVSVLRIGRTPHVNVGCCIENVLLHQNLTSGQTETFMGTKDSITEDPIDGSHGGEPRPVLSILVVLAVIVALALATGWLCRSRCPPRSYTGAQVARPELALTGDSRPAAAWCHSRFTPEAHPGGCRTQLAKESGPADLRVWCALPAGVLNLFSLCWALKRPVSATEMRMSGLHAHALSPLSFQEHV